MFNFLGALFGTGAAGEKLVDGIASAADKLVYTSQEQAEAAAKARSEGFAVYTEWLKSTTGSRLARRLLALMVTGTWMLEHIASVALATASAFATDATAMMQASTTLGQAATDNNPLVATVLLFYFGGPVAMSGVQTLMERWAEQRKSGSGELKRD